jgi:hypothetical protein
MFSKRQKMKTECPSAMEILPLLGKGGPKKGGGFQRLPGVFWREQNFWSKKARFLYIFFGETQTFSRFSHSRRKARIFWKSGCAGPRVVV